MSAPNPEALVGRVLLGKLEVIKVLGRGGMGAVYEVEHKMTHHRRALKVLHPGLESNTQAVARFLREATVAGTLRSPYVVETFDAGQLESGAPYVLMEKLEGKSLGDLLDGSARMAVAAIARIVWEAAQGIATAHRAGIVHRDLKPDNLFVANERDGTTRVKILDFGISKFAGAFEGDLTGEGTMLGTPYYMAPEQAESAKDADARADVYALGVILYEAVSGRRPFDDESFAALVVKIHEGECTPLERLVPSLDPAFAAIVTRAMHRDPARRFESADALAAALEPFAGGPLPAAGHDPRREPSTVPTPDSVRDAQHALAAQGKGRLYLAAGALAILGLGAVGAAIALGSSDERTPQVAIRDARPDREAVAGSRDAGVSPEDAGVDAGPPRDPSAEPSADPLAIDPSMREHPPTMTSETTPRMRPTSESAMLERDPWSER